MSTRWEVSGGAGPIEVAAIVAALECLMGSHAAGPGSTGDELSPWALSGRPGGEADERESPLDREAGWTGLEGGFPKH
jgi:hypothetical protein